MVFYKALQKYETNAKLATIGAGYKNEVGTSGERLGALTALEAALAKAFDAARKNQAASGVPQVAQVGGVKNLAAWHAAQMPGAKDAAQKALNDRVIFLRKWASRQGAWFTGDGKLHWPRTMKLRVVYDAEIRQQAQSMVAVRGGWLYDFRNAPFDTAGYVTHFSGPGKAIYVMSPGGSLHVASHSVGHRHHSSLLAGGPVACAGEIEVQRGRIVWLSNKSGHYHPGREHLLQVLATLQARGVELDFRLTVLGDEAGNFPSVEAFMKAKLLDNESYDKAVEYVLYVASLDHVPGIYDGKYH